MSVITGGSGGAISFTCTAFDDALRGATEETIAQVKAAIRSAINKMMSRLKTLTADEITAVFNVPRPVLMARLNVFQARVTDLEGVLVISGKSIPLPYFGARQVGRKSVTTGHSYKGLKTTRRKSASGFVGPTWSGGVEVQIRKGQTTVLRSAFLAAMKSGHVGVFQRGPGVMKTRSKYAHNKHSAKLYERAMVSIATMVEGAHGIHEKLVAEVERRLEEIFLHELDVYLSGVNQ